MTKQDVSQMVNTPETRRILNNAKTFPYQQNESAALRMIVTEWWRMKLMYPMTLPLEAQAPIQEE